MLFGQEHIDRYEATDGAGGPRLGGDADARSSPRPARSPAPSARRALIYGEHDGDYLVVASKGGAPEPPAWYVNLKKDPAVRIQVWGDKIDVTARDATDAEKSPSCGRS